jgi:hypothetical protein
MNVAFNFGVLNQFGFTTTLNDGSNNSFQSVMFLKQPSRTCGFLLTTALNITEINIPYRQATPLLMGIVFSRF